MQELIFLTPVFTHNIWGGTKLRDEMGYAVEGEDIGECWGIAAHPNGDCTVSNGVYAGKKLSELWKEHQELFGNSNSDRFPLLVKIIDAKDDLSIQVHPDDEYAAENENGSLGKTECWYILDCPENAKLVIGHNAGTRNELKEMIDEKRWKELIREVPVKKGDFIQIDPGTVHAIKGGFLILETQQNSDITYRLYDYDRLSNGKPRQLHIEQSKDVIKIPEAGKNTSKNDCIKSASGVPENKLNLLQHCKYYDVYKLVVKGEFSCDKTKPFMLMSVVDGKGSINGQEIKKGSHFIVTAECKKLEIKGDMEIIASTPD